MSAVYLVKCRFLGIHFKCKCNFFKQNFAAICFLVQLPQTRWLEQVLQFSFKTSLFSFRLCLSNSVEVKNFGTNSAYLAWLLVLCSFCSYLISGTSNFFIGCCFNMCNIFVSFFIHCIF